VDDVGMYLLLTFGIHILRPFVIFCGHLIYFMVIWYIFTRFGMLYKEKSGNPVLLIYDFNSQSWRNGNILTTIRSNIGITFRNSFALLLEDCIHLTCLKT
jgi:hypothetical protein